MVAKFYSFFYRVWLLSDTICRLQHDWTGLERCHLDSAPDRTGLFSSGVDFYWPASCRSARHSPHVFVPFRAFLLLIGPSSSFISTVRRFRLFSWPKYSSGTGNKSKKDPPPVAPSRCTRRPGTWRSNFWCGCRNRVKTILIGFLNRLWNNHQIGTRSISCRVVVRLMDNFDF